MNHINETGTKATIDISDIYTDQGWTRLVNNLGRLQTLEELEIIRAFELEQRRSGRFLRRLFEPICNLPRLTKLTLNYLCVSELSALQETFSNLRTVEQLIIDIDENSFRMSAEVAQSIASMPQLRELSITVRQEDSFDVSSLFSPGIESIVIEAPERIWLEEEHSRLLIQGLRSNSFSRLKKLHLNSVHFTPQPCPLIPDMLRENTTLEELRLSIMNLYDTDMNESCVGILEAMSHNNCLKSLSNIYASTFDEHEISSSTRNLQNQMLHRNTMLENFELFESEPEDESSLTDTEREKHMLLRLNKAGRKRLTGIGCASDWIDVMNHQEVRDDLSCLFYLVRMNPVLCQTNGDATAGRKVEDADSTRPTKRICR